MKEKKQKKAVRSKKQPVIQPGSFLSSLKETAARIERWVPWTAALIYFLVMGYLTFRYHRIGGFGVEIDFYAELVPQAKRLLQGEYSPLNYGAKGPIYSFLLAGFYLVIRDYFYAGLILNFVSGAVFIVTLYYLIRKVFNPGTAAVVMFLTVSNNMFLSFTYRAGSDLPFMAFCSLSMYFLFRNDRLLSLVLSAVFGLTAFLTRYNGAFIAMGSVVFLALSDRSTRERAKRTGLWISVFIFAGLFWFIPNWIVAGNPVHNNNYINVMLEFYGMGQEGVTYENWTDALPKEFTGMGDIFLYDPVYFLKHIGYNILNHFYYDMKILLGWRIGVFAISGLILIWFVKTDRKKLIFFTFGIFYFLILTLVFYNMRFSLYLLVFYFSLAVWPFMSPFFAARLKKYSQIPAVIFAILILSYSFSTTVFVLADMKSSPPILEDLKDLGLALDRIESDKSKIIIGRVPHVAYFAGLEALMFPGNVKAVEELVQFCRGNDVDYVLYTGIEVNYRPDMRILLEMNRKFRGLEKVYNNNFGVIYRVLDSEK